MKKTDLPPDQERSGEKRHYLEEELEALLQRPDTLHLLDDTILDGLWYWDLENPEHEYMSPTFWKTLGFSPSEKEHLASEWRDLIFAEDGELAQATAMKHLANPTYPYDQVVRYHRKDGSPVTIRCRAKAILKDGKPVRMLGAHTVVSDTKQTMVENRLSRMMDLSHDAIISWTEETGIETWNRGAEEMFGMRRAEALGQSVFKATRAELSQSWKAIRAVIETGEDWSGEIIHNLSDGRSVPTNSRITRIMLEDGRYLYMKISRDDTERQSILRHREMLLHELKHRVKNLFAVVQAMIGIAARSATDVRTLADDLRARLVSLAAAHTVSLKVDPSDPIMIEAMVREVVLPYNDGRERIRLSGDEVMLNSNAITPMGLILHEFATNAVKHGALREADGIVRINWTRRDINDTESEIVLEWRETGGTTAEPGDRTSTKPSGFGTILMENSARQLNGTLQQRFDGTDFCNILTFITRRPELQHER